jgi:hypothetical protein
MTEIVIIIALTTASLAVAISIRRYSPRCQRNSMADAALEAIYRRYQKKVQEYTQTYMLHVPPNHQWLAEIEDRIWVWDKPEPSQHMTILRRPLLYRLLTILVSITINAAIMGLLVAAILHRGAWWVLLIPACGLITALAMYGRWPRSSSTLLTRGKPVQAAIGGAIVGLMTTAILSGGAWLTLLIPACGLIMILIRYPHRSAARSDQHDIKLRDDLVCRQ